MECPRDAAILAKQKQLLNIVTLHVQGFYSTHMWRLETASYSHIRGADSPHLNGYVSPRNVYAGPQVAVEIFTGLQISRVLALQKICSGAWLNVKSPLDAASGAGTKI